MAYARIKVWIPGETLTASDLNSEFTGCIANENDLGTKLTAEISARTTLESEHDTLRTEFDTLDGNVWATDQIAADAVKTDSIEDLAVTDAKVATANKDGAAATVSMRTLGTGELQACAGNDSRLSDTRTPGDASVSQAKLKTSTGTVNINVAGGAAIGETALVLPGGEYGFYPRFRLVMNGAAGRTRVCYARLDKTSGTTVCDTGYITHVILWADAPTNTIDAGDYYAQQRYVTSSGEVFWIFILRDKFTKDILSAYQAPDHPCFGNGSKPLLVPHPFGHYDSDRHEIIVINPSDEEVFNMQGACIMPEDKPDKDILEVIMEDYEIDEDLKTPWTKKEVTVGLPRGIDWKRMKDGTKITPIKKQIPQPDFITTRKLWKK
jgi:hypothetical protein